MDVTSKQEVLFVDVLNVLASMPGVTADSLINDDVDPHSESFHSYQDSESIIEIEICRSDIKKEEVEEVSIRFAITHSEKTHKKVIELCEILCECLKMKVVDMRLRKVLELSDEIQILKSRKAYEQKRSRFLKLYNLSERTYFKPLRCGTEVFEYFRL
ncbi:hypothetical protein QWJ34_26285 [Saccharibacillus sp. CPCC 101409]|uniref:hypothetical protein n=1 Tax=Saccharibacillus sp. CPCC 101409 TaxID=3058041 RepID=UPI002673B421|nr:hypothetical protein [Saccharibacillus sp. CPCC 101409]MDO3413288.1 hypothetical protein [Saccharibacillus sp. CPCC 101409]